MHVPPCPPPQYSEVLTVWKPSQVFTKWLECSCSFSSSEGLGEIPLAWGQKCHWAPAP